MVCKKISASCLGPDPSNLVITELMLCIQLWIFNWTEQVCTAVATEAMQ